MPKTRDEAIPLSKKELMKREKVADKRHKFMSIKCKIRIILTSQLGFLDLWGYNKKKNKKKKL